MKLKTVEIDGKTYAEVQDGRPVFLHDDGKEVAFDAPGTIQTISRLNAEAKGHREAKEKAEAALKAFEGLPDADAARKALETVKALDAKKLIDAGEVEKVKAEIAKGYEEKLQSAEKRANEFEGQLYSERIGGAFARSKFISEKIAVPTDLVQAAFGSRFKIEDGKTVAYDANGQKIYSRAKPGEVADFEEALEIMVDAYPNRDSILKSGIKPGSGADPGGGQGGGKRTLTREQFRALPPAEQMKASQEATIVD